MPKPTKPNRGAKTSVNFQDPQRIAAVRTVFVSRRQDYLNTRQMMLAVIDEWLAVQPNTAGQ